MKCGIYGFNLGKSFSEVGQMPSNLLVTNVILDKFFLLNGVAFGGKVGNVLLRTRIGKWEDTQLDYS